MTYTMHIETDDGVSNHPFHLGSDMNVAERFVLEALNRPEVKSIALRKDKKLVRIYDWNDIDS